MRGAVKDCEALLGDGEACGQMAGRDILHDAEGLAGGVPVFGGEPVWWRGHLSIQGEGNRQTRSFRVGVI